MARHEQQREDLMRDARALVERAEFDCGTDEPHLILGRHSSGGISVYFGEDPVYHFTSEGDLRRAYQAGLLYKADGGALVEIERKRVPGAVELRTRSLTSAEQKGFALELTQRLARVIAQFDQGHCRSVAEIPADRNVGNDLMERLRTLRARPITFAQLPNVR